MFPNFTCLACQCELNNAKNGYLCDKCAEKLCVNTEPIVLRDTKQKQYFEKAYSAFVYKDMIASMIMRLKYNDEAEIACALALFMAATLIHNNFISDDTSCVIIPVPLSKKRLRKRGYNQALLLANELSNIIGLSVENNALARIKDTAAQKDMTIKQRQENLRDAFEVINPETVKNKKFLLVDDVFTSGSTVNECARVLKQAGAKRVDVITLACVSLGFEGV